MFSCILQCLVYVLTSRVRVPFQNYCLSHCQLGKFFCTEKLPQFRKSRRIRPQLPDLVLDGLLLDRGEESGETILEAWEFGKCCRVPYVDVADCCSCATESDANSPSAQLRPYFWHCRTSFWWPFSCSSWCVGSKEGKGFNRRRSCTFLGNRMI